MIIKIELKSAELETKHSARARFGLFGLDFEIGQIKKLINNISSCVLVGGFLRVNSLLDFGLDYTKQYCLN